MRFRERHQSSSRCKELSRLLELRPPVALLRERGELRVIRFRFGGVAGFRGGRCRAIPAAKTIRLALLRPFVFLQRERGLAELEQEIAKELSSGQDRARRD